MTLWKVAMLWIHQSLEQVVMFIKQFINKNKYKQKIHLFRANKKGGIFQGYLYLLYSVLIPHNTILSLYSLKRLRLLSNPLLSSKSFYTGGAKESNNPFHTFNDIIGIFGLSNWSSMTNSKNIWIH